MAVHSTKSTSQATSEGAADLAAEFSALRLEMAAMLARLKAFGATGADWAAGTASDAAEDGLASLKSEWDKLEKSMAGQARANPIRTIGIAALIGFAVGLLLRR